MIVDGRAIAQDILEEARSLVDGLNAHNGPLTMRAIVAAPTAATASYLRAKARAAEACGITFEVLELPADASTEEAAAAAQGGGADAVIVQLPLPEHIDTEAVLSAIPPQADADALAPAARIFARTTSRTFV